jgi:hypothetical protein
VGTTTTSSFDLAGLVGWIIILVIVVAIVLGVRAIWLARAPRPGQASPEQAEAYRQGALALGSSSKSHRGGWPSGLRRWWRQGYRDARRFGVDGAIAQLPAGDGT